MPFKVFSAGRTLLSTSRAVKLRFQNAFLGYPSLIWFFGFFIGPLVLVTLTTFAQRGTYGGIVWEWSFANYQRLFNPVFLEILVRSVVLALSTTLACLVIGFPMAWAMVTLSPKVRQLLLLLVALPFLMNLIIRVYALRLFFGYEGPMVTALQTLGFDLDPFQFSQNIYLVMYGMITSYLPFMLFPLYAGLEKFNFQLVEAAYDLGAKPFRAVLTVVIPNSIKSIANGCILVFVPALGEFVIPDLLGGAKSMLAGNLITEQFLKARDWPFGSTLSLGLILCVLLGLCLFKSLEARFGVGTRKT